ncbi:MAG: hypothetical protein FJ288_11735 [Planctomycetes bacterium]|nr:hypothetical protein [Planctomycetota bacterium]
MRILALVVLVATAGAVAVLSADYDRCFYEMEALGNWSAPALRDGKAFSAADFRNALDSWGMDGDCRPRIVSYFCHIAGLKSRLALWQHVPMHPSFTPLWIVTLVLAPILLYKALGILLASRPMAMLGAALYLASPGYLSSMLMLFHPGKPLANFAFILMLYLAVRANQAVEGEPADSGARMPRCLVIGLVVLLPVLLLADETVMFCLLIPPVFAWRLFVPWPWTGRDLRRSALAWGILLVPAVLFALAALLVLPPLCSALLGQSFDFGSYMSRASIPQKFDLEHLGRNALTLLSAGLVPWPVLGLSMPVMRNSEHVPWGWLPALAGAATAAMLLVRRDGRYWRPCRKAALLTGIFIVLMTLATSHHPDELILAGFYHGSIFSVLWPVLLATVLSALAHDASWRKAAAGLAAVCLVPLAFFNSVCLGRQWQEHNNWKALQWLAEAPYNPLLEAADPAQFARLYRSNYEVKYSPDTPSARMATGRTVAYHLWKQRRQPLPRPIEGQPLALRDLWVLTELYFMRTPDRLDAMACTTDPGWRTPWIWGWKQASAYNLALARLRPERPQEQTLPVLGCHRTAPLERDTHGREGRVVYPWFAGDLAGGLRAMTAKGYDLFVLDVSRRNLPPGPYWAFHRSFVEAREEGSLAGLGVRPVGTVHVDGREIMLFEILIR